MKPAPSATLEEQIGQIADEFLSRLQRGESPTVEEYVAANPELTDVLRDVLPLVRAGHSTTPSGPEPSRIPERLGEFRVVREIGRGGMGVVYEAVQEPLGRRVALKVLPAAVQLQPHYLDRFRREAQAAARLHHTNIVPVFGVGEATGIHFIAMQFIDGAGLDQSGSSKLGSSDVARFGLQVAERFAHAHAAGVLHRDIKPSNLLLDTAGAVWVTDFGLAKLADGDDLTGSGDFLGTLRYAAPERLSGPGDERSDVYSLGATLYELLTGRPAFGAANRDQLVRQIAQDEPASRLDGSILTIPRDLETVVLKALAKSPAGRYASAGAMADDLRRFLEGRPVTARRASLVEQAWRWCRRRPAVAGLLALSVTALLALLIVSLVANARLSTALTQVGAERDRAEDNAIAEKQAREAALKNLAPGAPSGRCACLAQVGSVKLQGVPLVEKVRRELLEDALKLSQEFLVENPSDPELRWETARAYLRVGTLRQLLGDDEAAGAANGKGIELLTALCGGISQRARLRTRSGQALQ